VLFLPPWLVSVSTFPGKINDVNAYLTDACCYWLSTPPYVTPRTHSRVGDDHTNLPSVTSLVRAKPSFRQTTAAELLSGQGHCLRRSQTDKIDTARAPYNILRAWKRPTPTPGGRRATHTTASKVEVNFDVSTRERQNDSWRAATGAIWPSICAPPRRNDRNGAGETLR